MNRRKLLSLLGLSPLGLLVKPQEVPIKEDQIEDCYIQTFNGCYSYSSTIHPDYRPTHWIYFPDNDDNPIHYTSISFTINNDNLTQWSVPKKSL